ncbi:hypothetical protein D3C81_2155540 [compost metagenome]
MVKVTFFFGAVLAAPPEAAGLDEESLPPPHADRASESTIAPVRVVAIVFLDILYIPPF